MANRKHSWTPESPSPEITDSYHAKSHLLEFLKLLVHHRNEILAELRLPPAIRGKRKSNEAAADELAEIFRAIHRLRTHAFGRCAACNTHISLERLRKEPCLRKCEKCAGR